jgi:hypothetical protein
MATPDRRAFLEALLASDDASPRDKLKASELLAELDRREPGPSRDAEAEFVKHYSDDPERLEKLISLAIESRLFDEFESFTQLVERKAEAIVEERAQAARAEMRRRSTKAETETEDDLQPEPAGAETTSDGLDASRGKATPAAKSAESEAEPVPDPHSAEVLERQWGRHRPRGLRAIPSRSSRLDLAD